MRYLNTSIVPSKHNDYYTRCAFENFTHILQEFHPVHQNSENGSGYYLSGKPDENYYQNGEEVPQMHSQTQHSVMVAEPCDSSGEFRQIFKIF